MAYRELSMIEVQEVLRRYSGGDIHGGLLGLRQLFARPAFRGNPDATPIQGLSLCSASTPPGGEVHGMCGYYAACAALRGVFAE